MTEDEARIKNRKRLRDIRKRMIADGLDLDSQLKRQVKENQLLNKRLLTFIEGFVLFLLLIFVVGFYWPREGTSPVQAAVKKEVVTLPIATTKLVSADLTLSRTKKKISSSIPVPTGIQAVCERNPGNMYVSCKDFCKNYFVLNGDREKVIGSWCL